MMRFMMQSYILQPIIDLATKISHPTIVPIFILISEPFTHMHAHTHAHTRSDFKLRVTIDPPQSID